MINFKKSDLFFNSRNRIFRYKLYLRVGLVFPSQKKLDRLLEKTVTMLKASHTSPGKLMSLSKRSFNGEDDTIGLSACEVTAVVSEEHC